MKAGKYKNCYSSGVTFKEVSGEPFQCENFISISADNFFMMSMGIYELIENEIKKGSVSRDFSRIVIRIAQPEEDGKTELGIEFEMR